MSQESLERRQLAAELARVASLFRDLSLSEWELAEKALPGIEGLLAKGESLLPEVRVALLMAKDRLQSVLAS